MKIDLKVENGKVFVLCNGEKLACSWLFKNHKGEFVDQVADLILFHCKEQLIKELQELKDA